MGETWDEIIQAMQDLKDAQCDILTITQYLRPSPLHHPIDRWVKPKEFVELSKIGYEMGFAGIMAGPLVRSSYRSGSLWARAMKHKGWEIPENLKAIGASAEQGLGVGGGHARQEAATLVARGHC